MVAGEYGRQHYMCTDCALARETFAKQMPVMFTSIDWDNDQDLHIGDEMTSQATAHEVNLSVANVVNVRAQST